MTYQRLLCLTEREAFVLCSAYCLLLFLSTPSLSASDPEPSMVQGDGWAATYGGAKDDRANIQQTRNGGYIMAGVTSSFGAGEIDVWVLKLRPDGSINPAYGFIRDTSISGENSSAAGITTDANPRDTGANPQDSQATVLDTNASIKILCP